MGDTSNAYREKKNPVAVNAEYCANDIFSAGRSSSKNDAPDIIHLLIGAQKCTVKGPALINDVDDVSWIRMSLYNV